MSLFEENIELKKKKKFFLYKRTFLFNCIFSIFILMSTATSLLYLRSSLFREMDTYLLISTIVLISFTLKYLLRKFQYRLNKVGVLLIEAFIVILIIHFILRIESLLNL